MARASRIIAGCLALVGAAAVGRQPSETFREAIDLSQGVIVHDLHQVNDDIRRGLRGR